MNVELLGRAMTLIDQFPHLWDPSDWVVFVDSDLDAEDRPDRYNLAGWVVLAAGATIDDLGRVRQHRMPDDVWAEMMAGTPETAPWIERPVKECTSIAAAARWLLGADDRELALLCHLDQTLPGLRYQVFKMSMTVPLGTDPGGLSVELMTLALLRIEAEPSRYSPTSWMVPGFGGRESSFNFPAWVVVLSGGFIKPVGPTFLAARGKIDRALFNTCVEGAGPEDDVDEVDIGHLASALLGMSEHRDAVAMFLSESRDVAALRHNVEAFIKFHTITGILREYMLPKPNGDDDER